MTVDCSSQVGGKTWNLGLYQSEKDAARAFDKVASVLGRPLNFPGEEAVDIAGWRSKGCDEAVADAVEAAKTFMASGGNNQASRYIGVNQATHAETNPWQARIKVTGQ